MTLRPEQHFSKECLQKAVKSLKDCPEYDPRLIRMIIRMGVEEQLNTFLGKEEEPQEGKFLKYIKEHSKSRLWSGEGDEAHDGPYYLAGAASNFFPLAARYLVEDGIKPETLAVFLIKAAQEILAAPDYSPESFQRADQEVLKLAFRLANTRNMPPEKAA